MDKPTPEEQRLIRMMLSTLQNLLSGSSEAIAGVEKRICACGIPSDAYLQFSSNDMSNPRRIYFCDLHFEGVNKALRLWSKEAF